MTGQFKDDLEITTRGDNLMDGQTLSFFTAVEHLDESIDLITLEIFCM
jgi:hypothetical protein